MRPITGISILTKQGIYNKIQRDGLVVRRCSQLPKSEDMLRLARLGKILGHYARLGHNDPLEGFASIIRDRRPRNATEVLRLVNERMKDPKDFDVALAVFAITTAFGKKRQTSD